MVACSIFMSTVFFFALFSALCLRTTRSEDHTEGSQLGSRGRAQNSVFLPSKTCITRWTRNSIFGFENQNCGGKPLFKEPDLRSFIDYQKVSICLTVKNKFLRWGGGELSHFENGVQYSNSLLTEENNNQNSNRSFQLTTPLKLVATQLFVWESNHSGTPNLL